MIYRSMLQFLQIRDLALMDSVSLEFDSGFTAVTGETGAGKSVLLGALALLAGNRAGKTIIRKGADSCEVEATLYFQNPERLNEALLRLELPACDEGELVLRRQVHRSKGGRIQINGALATLGALAELGEYWIDFHGPGEPQKLFHDRYQLEMLDLYARNQGKLKAYGEHYQEWKHLLEEMETLARSERLSEDESAFLQRQVEAVDALELTEESLQELERDFRRLDTARELTAAAVRMQEGLDGEEGMVGQLAPLVRTAQELASIDPEAGGRLASRVEALAIEMEDLASEYGDLARSVDFDEVTALAIQQRMASWLELKRKHGPTVQSVLAWRDELSRRIASQGDIEGNLFRMEKVTSEMEKSLRVQAEELRQTRVRASLELARKAQSLLAKLGFKKARFQIEVTTDSTLHAHGSSQCGFLFSANAGQDLLPLNKIASSGETARVMLALKAVLAEVDSTPVLVFDEVDANVGGEIGAVVGKELAALAAEHQVFCVTHLPQVASQATRHFVVSKEQGDKRTQVTIEPIHDDKDKRLEEIARMLGDRKSASARSHAKELLQAGS